MIVNPRINLTSLEEEMTNPQILIEITSKCNFLCSFCSYKKMKRAKKHMSIDLFNHIIKQLPELTTHQILLDVAGEPTLHPQFLEMASIINSLNMDVRLFSNGSLLKKEYLSIAGMQIISVSAMEKHFHMRCPGGNYKKYLNQISEYITHWNESNFGKTDIVLSIVYPIPEKKSEVLKLKGKLRSFAVQFLNKCGINRGYLIELNIDAQSYIYLKKKSGKRLLVTLSPILYGAPYPDKNENKAKLEVEKGFCDSAWRRISIRADGHIGFCCNEISSACAFTNDSNEIWNAPLKSIWLYHKNIQRIREDFKKYKPNGICRRCLSNHENNIKLSDFGGYSWFPPE